MLQVLIYILIGLQSQALDCKSSTQLLSVKVVCKSDELKALDLKLNDAFQKAKNRKKTNRTHLLASQKLWLEWLESTACDLEHQETKEEMAEAISCLESAYDLRIRELTANVFGYEKLVLKSYDFFDLVKVTASYPGPIQTTTLEFHKSLKNAEQLNALVKDHFEGIKQSIADRIADTPNSSEVKVEVLAEVPEYISISVTSTGFFGGAYPTFNVEHKIIDIANAKFVRIMEKDLIEKKSLTLRKKIFDDKICDTKKAEKNECLTHFCGAYVTEDMPVEVVARQKKSTVSPPFDLARGLRYCENLVTKTISTETLLTYFKPNSESHAILSKFLKK